MLMYQEEMCTTMLAELKSENPRAFAFFFDLHYGPLCYFAERLVRDQLVAEDIVEETFMKLWDKRYDFENQHGIKAFLYITTRNACINVIKQMQRDTLSQAEMLYLAEKKEGFVLNEMIRTEVLNVVDQELNKLPVQCRTVLKMSYVKGLKNHEIADKLDISIHTVRNQKARGLQILRTKFEGNHLLG
jgi:RNA polymerase sigma-70 factor (family 1)